MLAFLCEQGMRPGRCRPAASVRTGYDLQKMTIRIIEVNSAPAIPGVDLLGLSTARVGPIGQLPLANPLKDLVEIVLFHKEGIVLGRDLAGSVNVVQGQVVADS